MRRIAILVLAAATIVLAAPAVADAAWYWSENGAEATLEADYDGIATAYCYGRGYWIRLDNGLRGYRKFRCYTEMTDGSDDTGRFFVRGRWRYSFYWG